MYGNYLLAAPSISLSRFSNASVLARAMMPPHELLDSQVNGEDSGATAYFSKKSNSLGSTLPSHCKIWKSKRNFSDYFILFREVQN